MKPVLGIDLGTTKCVACVRLGDEFVEIPPDVGKPDKMLPSLFIHLRDGSVQVGRVVEREYEQNPSYSGQVVRNAKRFMRLDGSYAFTSGQKKFSPAEVLAEFLRALRKAAENYTDRLKAHPAAKGLDWSNWLDAVVITVPAYYGATERQATKRAARLAGFSPTDVYLLDEPVAAALANGVHTSQEEGRVLVVDLGGGTCDLTLLQTGGPKGFQELGRFGDNEFGGLDWDREISKRAIRKSDLKNLQPDLLGDDGLPDYMRYGEILRAAERAKILYVEDDRRQEFVLKLEDPDDPTHARAVTMPRTEFDAVNTPLCEYVGHLADRLLESCGPRPKPEKPPAGVKWPEVQRVLLVGGGSQIPGVQAVLKQRWGGDVTPPPAAQLAIARGAATYGQLLSEGKRLDGLSHPRCPHDIGVMAKPSPHRSWFGWLSSLWGKPSTNGSAVKEEYVPLLWRNTQLPARFKGQFSLSSRNPVVKIQICNLEYTRRKPKGAVNVLKTFKFSELPPITDGRHDMLLLDFEFDLDHCLHVKGSVRGQPIKASVVDFAGEGRLT